MEEVYLLLEDFKLCKVYGPIANNKASEAERFFRKAGYKTTIIPQPPEIEILQEWKKQNYGKAVDGCWVEGWRSCEHGQRSWLSLFKKMS